MTLPSFALFRFVDYAHFFYTPQLPLKCTRRCNTCMSISILYKNNLAKADYCCGFFATASVCSEITTFTVTTCGSLINQTRAHRFLQLCHHFNLHKCCFKICKTLLHLIFEVVKTNSVEASEVAGCMFVSWQSVENDRLEKTEMEKKTETDRERGY